MMWGRAEYTEGVANSNATGIWGIVRGLVRAVRRRTQCAEELDDN